MQAQTISDLRHGVIRLSKKRLARYFIVCWGFWYIFFSSSAILRPFYDILWPGLVVMGLLYYNKPVIRYVTGKGKSVFICMLAYLLVSCFSMLYTISFSTSLLFIVRMAIAFGFVLLISSLDCSDIILSSIKGYTYILLGISIIQYVMPSVYYSVFLPLLSMRNGIEVLGPLQRNQSVGFSNGSGANALRLCIGYCVFLSEAYAKREHRLRNGIVSAILFVFIFLTAKRSYSIIAVGLFVLVAFYTIPRRNRGTKIAVRILYVLLAFGALLLANSQFHFLDSFINKFLTMASSGDISNGRLSLYSQTFDLIKKYPFFGIGIDGISETSVGLVHNSYLQWIAELGLLDASVLILAFVVYPVYLVYKGWKLYLADEDADDRFTILSCSCLIMMYLISGFVAATFQSHNDFLLLTLSMALLACQINCRKKGLANGDTRG